MIEYKTNIKEFTLKKNETNFKKVKITDSKSASEYARQFYYDDIEIYESFFIILLNNHNNTIGYVKISQGGITGTVVDKRIVLKYAIESLATSFICVHNHPSGNTKPSNADIELTKSLKQAAQLLDIQLMDHVILTKESYTSLADEGLI